MSILLLIALCITAIELAFRYGSDTLDQEGEDGIHTRRSINIIDLDKQLGFAGTATHFTTFYVSTASVTTPSVAKPNHGCPEESSLLSKRQTYATTESTAYADDTTSEPPQTTGQAAPSDYAIAEDPCFVTVTVEETIWVSGSSIPISTDLTTLADEPTGSDCSSVTLTATVTSYLTDLNPTCTQTATVDVIITYSDSSAPVGTATVFHDIANPTSGCEVVTITNPVSSYLTDALPADQSCVITTTVTNVDILYMIDATSTYSSTYSLITQTQDQAETTCSTTYTTVLSTSYGTVVAQTTSEAYANPTADGTSSGSITQGDKGPSGAAYANPTAQITSTTEAPVTQISDGSVNAYVNPTAESTSASVPSAYATPIDGDATTASSISAAAPPAYATPIEGDATTDSTTSITVVYAPLSTEYALPQETDTISGSGAVGSQGSYATQFGSSTISDGQPTDYYGTASGHTSYGTTAIAVPHGTGTSLSTMTVIVDVFYSTPTLSISQPSTSVVLVTQTVETTTAKNSPTSAPDILPTLQHSQLVLGNSYSTIEYFCANYLGVLLAVALKELWAIVFSAAKMMEPFYQLQKPGGATVSETLLANYLSTWLSWRSFRSILLGQWVMIVTTLTYAFMSLLSPLATEMMSTIPTAWCIVNEKGDQQRCKLRWILQKPWTRGLEAVLALITLLIVILMIMNYRRKSGVQNNPSTLASMASLFHHRETIDELRALDPAASDKVIDQALSGSSYKIELYRKLDRSYHYGLVKVDPVSPTAIRDRYNPVNNPHNITMMGSGQSHFTGRALRDSIFLLWVAATFAVVLGYYLAKGKSPFNDFFNSGKWYPRFILTSVAVLINLHWKTLEREVRVISPYRRLCARRARPDQTILVALNGTPMTSIIPSLYREDIFHAFIAFIAITSDFLIIVIAGVPFSKTQVWTAFLGSAYASMAILCLMMVALFSLFIWRVQNEKMRLPREPDTLLGVWMMLANDRNVLRQEFKGAHDRDVMGQVSQRCMREGRTYYAGWLDWDMKETDGPRGREVMARDEITRRFVVDRDGDGRVVGYGHEYR